MASEKETGASFKGLTRKAETASSSKKGKKNAAPRTIKGEKLLPATPPPAFLFPNQQHITNCDG